MPDEYERLLFSDERWFPEGQPSSKCEDVVGQPVKLSQEAQDGGIAYSTTAVTDSDGKVTVEYISAEDI